jgi:hypothetical protein
VGCGLEVFYVDPGDKKDPGEMTMTEFGECVRRAIPIKSDADMLKLQVSHSGTRA